MSKPKYHKLNHNVVIYLYEFTNDVVNKYIRDDEVLWVVNAKHGRRLVSVPPGATAQEAYNVYQDMFR